VDPINIYHQLPDAGDVDLVSVVRVELISNGLGNNIDHAFDQDQHIIDARNKKPEVQRHLLNLYLNLQLMKAMVDSSSVRYCLLPDGEISDWLTYFKSYVLPFLKEHNLIQTPVSRPIQYAA